MIDDRTPDELRKLAASYYGIAVHQDSTEELNYYRTQAKSFLDLADDMEKQHGK